MKTPIIKKNNRCFVELPSDFVNSDNVEILKLRDGFYLIAMPLEEAKKVLERSAAPPEAKEGISEEEKSVAMKLLSIRFEQRTPQNVAKILNQKELGILKSLEKKGVVNIFVGKKYAGGVYNINDKVFSMLQSQKTEGQKAGVKPQQPETRPSNDDLNRKGYLVLNEKEALDLMGRIRERIKRGELKGLKGFDNNYYVVNSKFLAESSRKILKALDRERGVAEIARITKMEEDAVKAVLNFLAESGEVIEKRRNVYAAV